MRNKYELDQQDINEAVEKALNKHKQDIIKVAKRDIYQDGYFIPIEDWKKLDLEKK